MANSNLKPLILGVVLFGLGAGSTYFALHNAAHLSSESDEHATDNDADDDDSPDRPAFKELPGRWRPAAERGEGGEGEEQLNSLNDLGYAGGYEPSPDQSGVVFHATDLAAAGLNLAHDGAGPRATLMDMDGAVLHEWKYELRQLFDADEIREMAEMVGSVPDKFGYFRRVHAFPNGDLLAIFSDAALIKLDRNSNLLWAWRGAPHHDLWVDPDSGRIWTLTRKISTIPRYSKDRLSAEDFITVLSPGGELIEEFSILEAFERSDYSAQSQVIPRGGDLQHTNTIEVLDGRLADRSPAFAAGNVLISCCKTDTIAVVDPKSRKVVWSLSGAWHRQHQPTVLDNGRMLILDNRGFGGNSKVLEFDPFSQEVFWAYRHSDKTPFSTLTCGSNQRLANGNTLITETDSGRAFEVNREGKIVWEYLTPNRAGAEDQLIATLFEVIRLPADYFGAWLAE